MKRNVMNDIFGEPVEKTLSVEEVREILETPGYDAYGSTRLYVEYSSDSIYAGQTGSIKSTYYLDKAMEIGYTRFYSNTRS